MTSLLILVVVPIAAAAFLVAVLRRRTLVVDHREHAAVARVTRTTRVWRMAGLLLGIVGAAVLLAVGGDVDGLGRLLSLTPAVVGAGVVLGTVVGELAARPVVGTRRSATVETRRLRDVVPRRPAAVLAGSTLALAVVLLGGAARGAPDDLGRPGRAFAVECVRVVDGVAVQVGGTRGPWPGSFYAVPLGLATLLLGVLVLLALGAVVRRPQPGVESRRADAALRRGAAGTVVVAATFGALATLAPVALLMVLALDGPACPLGLADEGLRWLGLALAPLATAGAAAALGTLLAGPTVRVADHPGPAPAPADRPAGGGATAGPRVR